MFKIQRCKTGEIQHIVKIVFFRWDLQYVCTVDVCTRKGCFYLSCHKCDVRNTTNLFKEDYNISTSVIPYLG
jgi:hypothetical protein